MKCATDSNPSQENNASENFEWRPNAKTHSYNQDIAIACGLPAAVLYNHITYWLTHNLISGHDRIDGRIWTYQTIKEMNQWLPEIPIKQIRGALDILVEKGLLIKGCFNHNKFDHTTWYAVPDERVLNVSIFQKVNSMFPKGQIDVPERAKHKDNINTDSLPSEVIDKSIPSSVRVPPPEKKSLSSKIKGIAQSLKIEPLDEDVQRRISELKFDIIGHLRENNLLRHNLHYQRTGMCEAIFVYFSPNVDEEYLKAGKGLVILTKSQWEKLFAEYGKELVMEVCLDFSEGLIGKYKNLQKEDHNLNLRGWIRQRIKRTPTTSPHVKKKLGFRALGDENSVIDAFVPAERERAKQNAPA